MRNLISHQSRQFASSFGSLHSCTEMFCLIPNDKTYAVLKRLQLVYDATSTKDVREASKSDFRLRDAVMYPGVLVLCP